ncbi:hypothetical protein [Hymenobacter lucidus]|uniref:Uncharacterized protein n=1 Tax=Hymenobacter lucidus TaxID=2880930 RepID=A0ABS8AN24_9BACT|nr:hypothetical protein [Hymenobacter lucidus]MCB2407443.1 hypothetical protein [Hymenobacter lucidus]
MIHFSRTRNWRGLIVLALALLSVSIARAQQPVIQRIYLTDTPGQDSVFRLGNTIALEVTGLNRWLKLQESQLISQGFDPQKAHSKARELVLYIDDAPIVGMPPLALYVDESGADEALTAAARRTAQAQAAHPDSAASPADPTANLSFLLDEYPVGIPDKVIFKLERNVNNYRYWDVVYDSPWDYYYTGKIGLGYEDRVFTKLHPTRTSDEIRLVLIQPLTLWIAVLGTIALGLGLLVLGARSWLLRITLPRATTTTAIPPVAVAQPPFSLAKVQMAWWTFIILGSFLVIYCVSGEMPDISTTSLALLGISGGTTALNGLIPRNPPPATATTGPWLSSRGWLPDILSDSHGVSMNRLQQVVISLLMGYFFVRTVYNSVAMPVWTDNQILLLAVSSATYLGLEWQGNRVSDDPNAAPAGSVAYTAPASTTTFVAPVAPGPAPVVVPVVAPTIPTATTDAAASDTAATDDTAPDDPTRAPNG